LLIASRY